MRGWGQLNIFFTSRIIKYIFCEVKNLEYASKLQFWVEPGQLSNQSDARIVTRTRRSVLLHRLPNMQKCVFSPHFCYIVSGLFWQIIFPAVVEESYVVMESRRIGVRTQ